MAAADIVDDQELAFESLLYNAAVHREDMLRNFYRVGQDQIHAFFAVGHCDSEESARPRRHAAHAETLAFGAVEIGMDARWRLRDSHATALFGIREGAARTPALSGSDALSGRPAAASVRCHGAHVLPLLFGVDVKFVEKPVPGQLRKADLAAPAPASSIKLPIPTHGKRPNEAWAAGGSVWRNEAGDFALARQGAGWSEAKRPRIGLYKSWMADIDEGWTRWLLEQFGFAYKTLRNADVQAGNLRARFDAIVFADEAPDAIENGYGAGRMPPEFTGGLGAKGAEALREFAAAGGA